MKTITQVLRTFLFVVFVFMTNTTFAEQFKTINMSCRTALNAGDGTLIVGFIIKTPSPRRVLVRAVGPALAMFGVPNYCKDPNLRLMKTMADGTNQSIDFNDDWDTSIGQSFLQIGAFALLSGSKDAAMVVTLDSGQYSAVVNSPDMSGIVLVEVYDLDSRTILGGFTNISVRGRADEDDAGGSIILGFVQSGSQFGGIMNIMGRAVGPSLSKFGIKDYLPDPFIRIETLPSGAKDWFLCGENDDYWVPYGNAPYPIGNGNFVQLGMFPFIYPSKDAALWIGNGIYGSGSATYIVTVRGNAPKPAKNSGVVLVELYFWQSDT